MTDATNFDPAKMVRGGTLVRRDASRHNCTFVAYVPEAYETNQFVYMDNSDGSVHACSGAAANNMFASYSPPVVKAYVLVERSDDGWWAVADEAVYDSADDAARAADAGSVVAELLIPQVIP